MYKKIIISSGLAILLSLGAFFFFNNLNNKITPTLELGYVDHNPLIIIDRETNALSGVSYDIAEAIAEKLGQELTWTKETTWSEAIGEMNGDAFDAVGIQMWPDPTREDLAIFTHSAMQSPVYAYARIDDTRFTTGASNLFIKGLTVATVDTQITGTIVETSYPHLTMITRPGATYDQMFTAVANGDVDVIFAEPQKANEFMNANPGLLVQIDKAPVRTFDNSFAFKKTDSKTVEAWNKAIDELIQDGTIKAILKKYDVIDVYTF